MNVGPGFVRLGTETSDEEHEQGLEESTGHQDGPSSDPVVYKLGDDVGDDRATILDGLIRESIRTEAHLLVEADLISVSSSK